MPCRDVKPFASSVAVFLALALFACGGGGGGGGDDGGGSATGRTTFTGNVADVGAASLAQSVEVEVCVEGTSFCTFVDAGGFFTLAADIGGTVTLVFTAPDFVARVTLTGIPLGATVRLRDIRCSTVTGLCVPDDLEIDGGDTVRGPIRCEQGPVHITTIGELVIDGDGEDCIRTAGQCEVTIEADRITLLDCEHCVRASGGSDVALLAGPGGIDCDAGEVGIRAEGNPVVRLDALGDVVIRAGEDGVRSSGAARIELAGDLCRVEGGESAIRTNGGGEVVTDECTALDLLGDVDHGDDGDEGEGDGDDDEHEDDDDHHGGDDQGEDV